jgi:multimeric flavodoxin WrbA
MIKLILEGLKYVNGETEAIRIAQGKYKLPTTIKEGYKALKQELKWQ